MHLFKNVSYISKELLSVRRQGHSSNTGIPHTDRPQVLPHLSLSHTFLSSSDTNTIIMKLGETQNVKNTID